MTKISLTGNGIVKWRKDLSGYFTHFRSAMNAIQHIHINTQKNKNQKKKNDVRNFLLLLVPFTIIKASSIENVIYCFFILFFMRKMNRIAENIYWDNV